MIPRKCGTRLGFINFMRDKGMFTQEFLDQFESKGQQGKVPFPFTRREKKIHFRACYLQFSEKKSFFLKISEISWRFSKNFKFVCYIRGCNKDETEMLEAKRKIVDVYGNNFSDIPRNMLLEKDRVEKLSDSIGQGSHGIVFEGKLFFSSHFFLTWNFIEKKKNGSEKKIDFFCT